MIKVLLIFPPYTLKEEFGGLSEVGNMLPPLGIGYIGAVLEEVGFEVKIIDAPPLRWGINKIVTEAKKFAPDFIGISSSTVSFNRTVSLAKALKKALNVPIILGGPHVTALPEETLRHECFDFGIIGEGEETIRELIPAIIAKKNLKTIAGIIYRRGGKIIKTTLRAYLPDLDELPLPARHLMPPLTAYHPTPATFKKFPVATMISSRGCPNRCSFCFRGVFGNRWRFRSPQSVVEEMETLVVQFGAREIRIWDDTFNVDIERVKAICRLIIKKKLKITWTCLGRVNRVDRPMLKLMKKAGCWQISYGIESGNDDVLKSINKGITKEMVKRAVRMTHEEGLQSLGFFIIGLPGETAETIRETIDFAKQLPLSAANFTVATPYPGTDLWERARQNGALRNISYDKLVVNLPDTVYFVPDGLSAESVRNFERKAYREFYRNPAFILRQLKDIDGVGDLWRKVRAFFTIQSV